MSNNEAPQTPGKENCGAQNSPEASDIVELARAVGELTEVIKLGFHDACVALAAVADAATRSQA